MVQKGVFSFSSAGIDDRTNWAAAVPAESPKTPVCPAQRERERQRGSLELKRENPSFRRLLWERRVECVIYPILPITNARVLLKLGDSITTDHISPAGAFPK